MLYEATCVQTYEEYKKMALKTYASMHRGVMIFLVIAELLYLGMAVSGFMQGDGSGQGTGKRKRKEMKDNPQTAIENTVREKGVQEFPVYERYKGKQMHGSKTWQADMLHSACGDTIRKTR